MGFKREKRNEKEEAKYKLKVEREEVKDERESSEEEREMEESSEEGLNEASDEHESGESEIDDEPELDLENNEPNKKKKKAFHDNTDFTNIMGQILNQTLTTEKENNAILSKSKGLTKKIEEEKLEYRARKALIKEKKALKEKDHVLPDIRTMDYERKLKKVATSGVVRLFNAIRVQQKQDNLDHLDLKNEEKVEVAKMSKASFLDMLKAGSNNTA